MEWKQHIVRDTDNHQQPAYVNYDKNGRTMRTEIQLKALRLILTQHKSELGFAVTDKKEGIIKCSWQPMVKLEVIDSSTTSLKWHKINAKARGIDMDGILRLFNDSTNTGEVVLWE